MDYPNQYIIFAQVSDHVGIQQSCAIITFLFLNDRGLTYMKAEVEVKIYTPEDRPRYIIYRVQFNE